MEGGCWSTRAKAPKTEPDFPAGSLKAGSTIEPFLDHFDADYSVVNVTGTCSTSAPDKDAPGTSWQPSAGTSPKQGLEDADRPRERRDAGRGSHRQPPDRGLDARRQRKSGSLQPGRQKQRDITLPTLGTVGGFSGRRQDKEGFYPFTSFTYPSTVYRFDFTTGKSSVFKRPKVDFKPAAFETKQVFFASKDGTKIPMFLVSKKGLKLDGQNPTLVFTGDHDDRVVPAHSFKFAAQLQADQSALAPALIRIETNAGHGAGKPTAKLIDEAADEWAFAVKNLGMKTSLNP